MMAYSSSWINLLIGLALLIGGSAVATDDLCACSSEVCNCLRANITNIVTQVTERYCTPKLRTLTISDNALARIEDNAFKTSNCTGLAELAMRKTQLTALGANDFVGLKFLTTLNIGDNNISKIHQDAFVSLTSLQQLHLDRNRFKTINNQTFTFLVNLELLDLHNNKIGFIENNSFQSCTRLKRLDLSGNILTELKKEMFSGLKDLENLNLAQNLIQRIAKDTFVHLIRLKTLLLSNRDGVLFGGFDTLPDKVFASLSELRTLNVSALKISSIGEQTFAGLTKLEHLHLRGNRLTNITQTALQGLEKLAKLDLSNNLIRCLQPAAFSGLTGLRQLDLSGNKITYVGSKAFEGMDSLRLLNMDFNNIRVIESNTFCNLQNLFVVQMNSLLGRVAYDAVHNYADTAFAKLPNASSIIGVSLTTQKGMSKPCTADSTPDPMYNGTACPVAMGRDLHWFDADRPNGSRKYLLIIVAICVAFLLIAFAVIMTYRAWSKHKMTDDGAEDQAEKQEMLERGTPGQTNANTGPAEYVNGGNGTTAVLNHHHHHHHHPPRHHPTSSATTPPTNSDKTTAAPPPVDTAAGSGPALQEAAATSLDAHPQVVVSEANGATITTFGVV